jgi:hypothetical protein
MIQRIQSLYLVAVTGCMVALMAMPVGVLTGDDLHVVLSAFDCAVIAGTFQSSFPVWLVGTVAGISALIAFTTIFLYKKRKFQTTLCFTNGVIIALLYALYLLLYATVQKGVDLSFAVGISVAFPAIGLSFNILAVKAIAKDVELVESLNRIR